MPTDCGVAAANPPTVLTGVTATLSGFAAATVATNAGTGATCRWTARNRSDCSRATATAAHVNGVSRGAAGSDPDRPRSTTPVTDTDSAGAAVTATGGAAVAAGATTGTGDATDCGIEETVETGGVNSLESSAAGAGMGRADPAEAGEFFGRSLVVSAGRDVTILDPERSNPRGPAFVDAADARAPCDGPAVGRVCDGDSELSPDAPMSLGDAKASPAPQMSPTPRATARPPTRPTDIADVRTSVTPIYR